MSEAADQLVMEYLGRVADISHGRLNAQERLDFINRLRRRIDEYRGGSDNPRRVRQVLDRFGDPGYLVERERRRLDQARADLAQAVPPALNGDAAPGGSDAAGALSGVVSPGNGRADDAGDAGEVSTPRPPMRVIRRNGRTTRHVVWSPSGVAKLRRELRAQPHNGRVSGAARQAWQAVVRQWTGARRRKSPGG
jgi:hypothetical protein